MKKRTISVLLGGTLLFTACGGSSGSSDTATASGDTTTALTAEDTSGRDKSDLPESYDLEGFTFKVLTLPIANDSVSMDTIAPEDANGEVLNDTLYNRNLAVMSKYNFSIENHYDSDVLAKLTTTVLADEYVYDAAMPHYDSASMKMNSGCFANLYEIENLNMSKNYWDQSFNKSVSIDGKLCFAVGDLIVSDDDVLMMILYNSDLAEDLGIENLYDAVNEGRWTYDMLRKYVKQAANDVDGDGKISEKDTVGFLWAGNNCVSPHFAAVGQTVFAKDEDDLPILNDSFERGYRMFDILSELLDQNRYSLEWTQFGGDQVKVITSLVSNKQVLFQNMILSQVRRLYRDVTANFGLLPMPKSEESDENYTTTVWKNFHALVIPANNPELAKTGFVVEALAEASDKVSYAYYDICLQSKYTRDAESFDMIELARKNVVYDIGFIYDWGKLYSSITNAAANGDFNLASIVAANSSAAKEAAAKFVEELQ